MRNEIGFLFPMLLLTKSVRELIGIVILSRNFFDRLELNSMVFLMNILKFRILPLYHGIDHLDLLERYPLLTNIRGETADQDCDTLVSKLEDVLRKTAKLVNRPLEEPQAVALSKSNSPY